MRFGDTHDGYLNTPHDLAIRLTEIATVRDEVTAKAQERAMRRAK